MCVFIICGHGMVGCSVQVQPKGWNATPNTKLKAQKTHLMASALVSTPTPRSAQMARAGMPTMIWPLGTSYLGCVMCVCMMCVCVYVAGRGAEGGHEKTKPKPQIIDIPTYLPSSPPNWPRPRPRCPK